MTENLHPQHQTAYQAVIDTIPGSELISHQESNNPNWERSEVRMVTSYNGPLTGCPVCGDPYDQPGLTKRCKDDHNVY